MHAPELERSMSTSSTGYEDGLGRRVLAFDRADGAILERLYLRPELAAFEPALADLAARASALADDRVIAPLGLDRDETSGELVLISPFAGDRLIDLLDTGSQPDESAAPGIDVALGFLLELLPALESLRATLGHAHGLLGPSRIVVTAQARVALTECIFAPVLPHLNLTRRRLWNDFRVATPAVAGQARFDAAADLGQSALVVLSLVLGRPLDRPDVPELLPELLAEVVEIAQIRGSVSFAVSFQRFLQRALPLPGRRAYPSVAAALADVRDVASKIGLQGCESALRAFCSLAVGLETSAIDEPVFEEPIVAVAPPPVAAPAMEVEIPVVVDAPVAAAPPIVEDTPTVAPATEPSPVAIEPATEERVPDRPARRRRSAPREDAPDALRSETSVPEPFIPVAPPAPAPVTIAVQPVAPPPPTLRVIMPPEPIVPQPVFRPIPLAPATSPVVPLQPSPYTATPIAAAPSAPLRLKAEPPRGYAPPPPRYDNVMFAQPAKKAGVRWKVLAAAAVITISVAVAGVTYLPDRSTVSASSGTTAPRPAPAAAPVATTGILEAKSEPAGAKVLLDGDAVGETPLRIADIAPGRHVLTFITPSASVKKTIRVEAGKTLTIDVPVFSGWVAVFAPVVLQVSENGQALGTTENGRLLVSPGRHTLTLSNHDLGYSVTQVVDIEAGEVKSVNLDPRGVVNLNAIPWAEVWVDGKKAGDTPLANLSLPLGTREIVFKHPQYGERRITTTVSATAPTAISVDLTKPIEP
jgi:PEGA domain-containing protein